MSVIRPLIGLCDLCKTPVRNYGTVPLNPANGKTFILCGHHTNVHRTRLAAQGWLILEPTLVDFLDAPTGPFEWMPPPPISRQAEDCDTPDDETRT